VIPQQARAFFAEVLGTFTLVFGGCLTIAASTNMGDGSIPHIAIAFGFGLALLAGLFAFADVSGGHFNPAVSLAMWLSKRMSLKDMVSYWGAQAIGGIAGCVILYWITDRATVKGTTTLPGLVSTGSALIVEAVLTGIFIAVILSASEKGTVGIIAIPLTLVIVHLAGIPFSGASVNPARSLGSALIGGNWHAFWIYLAGPAIGAVLAWLAHTVVIKGEKPGIPQLS